MRVEDLVERLERMFNDETTDWDALTEAATLLRSQQDRIEALDWFGNQHRLELFYYSPVYGDDDDQDEEWRVTEVVGSINDREWTIVGRGETPIEAITAARSALTPSDPKGITHE